MRDWITLVTGLPRSGTSLVMQMLGAGGMPLLCDESRAADEDNPRGYFEYAPVKRIARDISWLDEARGRAVKIVLGLLAHLPLDDADYAYRVILVRRDIAEVMASQDAMLARRGEGSDFEAGHGLSGAAQSALRDRFARQLAEIAAGLRALPGVELLEIEHRDLIAEPARVAAEVDAFLGGGLDVSAMAACVEPALYRQREAAPASSPTGS